MNEVLGQTYFWHKVNMAERIQGSLPTGEIYQITLVMSVIWYERSQVVTSSLRNGVAD